MIPIKESTPGLRMVGTAADVAGGLAAVRDDVCLFQGYTFQSFDQLYLQASLATMMVAAGLAPSSIVSGSYTQANHFALAFNEADGLCAYVWNTTWNPHTSTDDAVVKHYKVPIDAEAMCATGISADGFPQNKPAIETLGASLFGPPESLVFLFVGRPVSNGWMGQNQFYPGMEDTVPHPHVNLAYLSSSGVFTAQFGSHTMFRAPLSAAAAAIVANPANAAYFSVPATQNFYYNDAHNNYTPMLRTVYDAGLAEVSKALAVYKTTPYSALTAKGFLVTGLDAAEFDVELVP